VVKRRATYGHRRVTARVNRLFGTRNNRKRIRRVMQLYGLTLPKVNRRRGRAHTGRVMRDRSDERWCSDELVIPCWSGEVVHVAFVLDCHDREVLAKVAAARPLLATDIQELMRRAVAQRFGDRRPSVPIQWLSDNGSIYTARATEWEAEQLHLQPITTPASSPESNGMSEAFVNTLKRDYVDGADCSTAALVLSQLPQWIEDYNEQAPHSALGVPIAEAIPARTDPEGGTDTKPLSVSRIGGQSTLPALRLSGARCCLRRALLVREPALDAVKCARGCLSNEGRVPVDIAGRQY
jgi:transposase InsO family protein